MLRFFLNGQKIPLTFLKQAVKLQKLKQTVRNQSKSVSPSYSKIISALNELAKSEKAPDQVVTVRFYNKGQQYRFVKVEVVAASEKYENTLCRRTIGEREIFEFLDAKKRKADKK